MNAADQVHGDLHVFVGRDALNVVDENARGESDAAGPIQVANHNVLKPYGASRPARDAFGLFEQYARHPGPDGPHADEGD
jgi:hypothetical protein